MQGKQWLIVVSLLVSAAFGCKEPNPYRCPDGEHCPPVGGPCESAGECGAPTSVCNEETMTCVECTKNTDCAATRPVCSGQNMCVQCQVHDDCFDSKLCLAGGICADPNEVTYVAETGATLNPSCTIDMPCQNITQALSAIVLRKYIRITGRISDAGVSQFDNKRMDVYGVGGARLSRSFDGEVVIVKGASEVRLFDLDITGNAGGGGKDCVEIADSATATMIRVNVHNHGQAGISLSGTARLLMFDSQVHDNSQEGVKAALGTTVELNRSSIYKNSGMAGVYATSAAMVTINSSVIAANTGAAGGVSITGPFSIRNSIISANGNVSTTTSAGGLTLNPMLAANAKFEFNTVADNSSASSATGLACNIVSFDVSNSIFTGNSVNNCNAIYSLTDSSGTPTGTNKVGDPMFVTKALLDPMFYRISSASAARDSADPAATLDVDIDGDPRSDARKDMGADEFR